MRPATQRAADFRAAIVSGRVQWGTFLVECTSPAVPTVLKNAGLDFTIIDNEHSSYSQAQTRALLDGCTACDLPGLVRTPFDDLGGIARALDGGSLGMLFPRVRTLDEARRAVESTKYPPLGRRGVHLLRPHTAFSPPADAQAYFAEANAALITGVQIETTESIEIIEEIAALEGVDMLYIGPNDLRADLMAAGRNAEAETDQVERRVVAACRANGKISGCHTTREHAARLVSRGFQVLGHGAAIRLLSEGVEAFVRVMQNPA